MGTGMSGRADQSPTGGIKAAASPLDRTKARLKAEFPGWSIIHSDRGRWWAMRGPLDREDLSREASVDADTAEELAERIRAVSRGAL
ncbi:hypothetical protein GCM10022254_56730 [Actinomadura meridiana]|uniref:Uncharacterized protein n=1 Tax=Actinomadura meridiana TaxID=559626 RepID=A0ABP8CGW8_9ACTN